MRQLVLAYFFLVTALLPQTAGARESFTEQAEVLAVGTIVPKHARPEVFAKTPKPIIIRLINRARHPVYLQGFRQHHSKTVHFFFYHRDNAHGKNIRGWKPFFESLPCNHPACQNLNALPAPCEKSEPYVIRLGPAGSDEAVKEFSWKGLLYQKIEATMSNLKRRICYKGWAPGSGRIRIEVEYSDAVQRGRNGYWEIGGRSNTAIEFDLPALKKVYVISVGQ